jgi:hypothetical protein
MVKHFNPTIALDTQRIFNFKSTDMIPAEVGNMLVPVIPIERTTNIVKGLNGTATGSTTIYTTPTDKDFYLNQIHISWATDVVCDSTGMSMTITIDGVAQGLIRMNKIALREYYTNETIVFKNPIKVTRGSIISINQTFTVGTMNYSAFIYGYTVETTI